MAKARMLHKAISISVQVSNLSLEAQLLFTWLIAHADDEGRLKGEPKYIKATVVPYAQWTVEEVCEYLGEIHQQSLISYWQENNQWFIEFPTWKNYQYIAKDRFHKSSLPSYIKDDVYESYTDGIQNSDTSTTQSNLVEDNQVKTNKTDRDNIYSDIDSIKEEDITEISEKLSVPVVEVEKQLDKLYGYCASTGKEYDNYKAVLYKFVQTEIERKAKSTARN